MSNHSEWEQDIRDLAKQGQEKHAELLQFFELSAKKYKFSALFSAVYASLLHIRSLGERDLYSELTGVMLEWFAFYTYSYAQDDGEVVSSEIMVNCTEALKEFSRTRFQTGLGDNDLDDPFAELRSSLKIESEIVRGSAYPEQTSEEIIKIQGRFDKKFAELCGISPSRAVAIVNAVTLKIEEVTHSGYEELTIVAETYKQRWIAIRRKKSKDHTKKEHNFYSFLKTKEGAYSFGYGEALAKFSQKLPVGRNDIEDIQPRVSEKEWNALIELIGFTQTAQQQMTQPVEAAKRPFYVLEKNEVLILDISNTLDALWNAFEGAARLDEKFFSSRYAKAKGDWLEHKAQECFKYIFPKNSVYSELTYPDPEKKSGAETELDLAISWGPFLILIEVKAKQFKFSSQIGDVRQLRRDLKANIEDAYYQAKRAINYIESENQPVFKEKSTGRKLTIEKPQLSKILLLTISQHYLSGLANQFALLNPLNLFKENEYPVSFSVGSLELISEVCEAPDIFMHYLDRRTTLQRSMPSLRADELDLFGAYLDTRLQEYRFLPKADEEMTSYDVVVLDGFRQAFDVHMSQKRGLSEEKSGLNLSVPPVVKEMLTTLRKDTSVSARGIAFSLLDLPDVVLHKIEDSVKSLRTEPITPNTFFRRAIIRFEDTLVFVLASINQPEVKLNIDISARLEVEKYRYKAQKAIGIGIMLPEPNSPITTIRWIDRPWNYDSILEELVVSPESEPVSIPFESSKLPGRNDLCFCGSRRKYKHCHLRKVEEGINFQRDS